MSEDVFESLSDDQISERISQMFAEGSSDDVIWDEADKFSSTKIETFKRVMIGWAFNRASASDEEFDRILGIGKAKEVPEISPAYITLFKILKDNPALRLQLLDYVNANELLDLSSTNFEEGMVVEEIVETAIDQKQWEVALRAAKLDMDRNMQPLEDVFDALVLRAREEGVTVLLALLQDPEIDEGFRKDKSELVWNIRDNMNAVWRVLNQF